MAPSLPRMLGPTLERALRLFPVVALTGARQTGKSTLVRLDQSLADRSYATLDTEVTRDVALREPRTLLTQSQQVTIDEVQRAPDMLLTIKELVDQDRTAGRFLLTGSANLLLMRGVSESLAGRARYLTLWPMTRREQLGMGEGGLWSGFFSVPNRDWPDLVDMQITPEESWRDLAKRGGYPVPALSFPSPSDDADRAEIFAGYTQTYLERDLRDLSAVDSLPDFQRLMRAAALRIGSVLDQSALANDAGLARTTTQRYLNLLEVSYQLVRVEPYSVNRTKRLVKSPKMYWSDTGLALYLSGDIAPTGAHLENLVLTDLLAWKETETVRPTILYWRTSTGAEVDFVIEWKGKLLAIEVKSTTKPIYDDAKGVRMFLSEYGQNAVGGILLHAGSETYWLSDRVLAVPWWKVM